MKKFLLCVLFGMIFKNTSAGCEQPIAGLDSLAIAISQCLVAHQLSHVTIANFVNQHGEDCSVGQQLSQQLEIQLNDSGIVTKVPSVLELYWEQYRNEAQPSLLLTRFHLAKVCGVDAVIVGEIKEQRGSKQLVVELLHGKTFESLAKWCITDVDVSF